MVGHRSTGSALPRALILMAVLAVALFVTYPWQTATVATLAYLASLPFSWSAFLRRERAERERDLKDTTGEGSPTSDGQP